MKKRILPLILIAFIPVYFYSQKYQLEGPKEKIEKTFKNKLESPMTILVGYDKDYDEAVKFAFNKYWKFTPVTFEDYKTVKEEKLKSYFQLTPYQSKEVGISYYLTSVDWACKETTGPYKGRFLRAYYLSFDNFTKGDNEPLGTDNNFKDFSNKVIPYVAIMCTQLKLLTEIGARDYYNGGTKKDKVKEKAILIPEEYIKNGLSDASFKSAFEKIEFTSAVKIKERIMSDKDLDNNAELLIAQDMNGYTMMIVDLKNGDLLSYSFVGKTSFNEGKKIDDDVVKKLISRLK